MTVAIGLGVAIGILVGLLGGGGSILAVPALVYGTGMSLESAVPTSLIVVGVSSATALIPRVINRQVRWRIAGVFGAAGVLGAVGGAVVNRLLDPEIVMAGFAAMMVVAGVRMLFERVPEGGDCELPGGKVRWQSCLPKAIGSGVVVGFLTGLFGVGGGFMVIPALVLLLGLPMATAVGTSLLIVVVNSVAGFIAHIGPAELDVRTAVIFSVAAVLGSLGGSWLSGRIPEDPLRRWFAYFVFAVAAFVAVEILFV